MMLFVCLLLILSALVAESSLALAGSLYSHAIMAADMGVIYMYLPQTAVFFLFFVTLNVIFPGSPTRTLSWLLRAAYLGLLCHHFLCLCQPNLPEFLTHKTLASPTNPPGRLINSTPSHHRLAGRKSNRIEKSERVG
ncbi:unnamed protein product [Protopolystoma xenopodis]|uniref:Uncharacterized protein n=1 Tax=Protopolystoma xenopodis TaxID=117903 RepID=A0A448XN14_9PLAT|nr:unnamed protein product [Protopolystoma xenopodis]